MTVGTFATEARKVGIATAAKCSSLVGHVGADNFSPHCDNISTPPGDVKVNTNGASV